MNATLALMSNIPDLQCAGTEHTRSLVFGHVWCGAAVLGRDLLVLDALHCVERLCCLLLR